MNKNKTIFLVSNLISLTSLDLCRDDFGSLCGKHTASPWVNIIKRWQEGIPSERHWKHSASRKRILNLAKQPTGNAYLCQTLCNRFSKTNKNWLDLSSYLQVPLKKTSMANMKPQQAASHPPCFKKNSRASETLTGCRWRSRYKADSLCSCLSEQLPLMSLGVLLLMRWVCGSWLLPIPQPLLQAGLFGLCKSSVPENVILVRGQSKGWAEQDP